ncbi:MAG: hypothetical protein JSU03_13490 [Bacteroidetes bacterium]|nr:hypothetical protein [Bacteroidota bacterium]MBS1758283.1 hypothetical protein [Bacteroidota bacterium]
MKQAPFLILVSILFLVSCHSQPGNTTTTPKVQSPTVEIVSNFFPVTTFIKGQIHDIRQDGANPIRYTTIHQVTDSSWLKMPELDTAFADFLTPLIDTANLISLFTEKKFLDQDLNAYTFSYDAKAALPDSMNLLRWDVYVNPESNKVKRIYLVKKAGAGIEKQLTWEADNWAKIVTLKTTNDGTTTIEKEQTIKWKF